MPNGAFTSNSLSVDTVVENRLDLRGTPTWEHHAQTCKAFDDLSGEQVLYITYDYEPRPLRQRFAEQYAEHFVWSQRRVGDGRWEVALRRLNSGNDRNSLATFLDRCPVFSVANGETRAALARIAVTRSIGRNQSIAGQAMDWPFLGAVREGRIFAIAETPEGRDQILFEVAPYEVFGDIIVFDRGATIARFATLSSSAEIVLLPRADVLSCAAKDAGFAMAVAESCAQRTRTLIELVCAHVSKPTIARVAAAILPHAPTDFGLAPVDPGSIHLLRLNQLAASAGTVKEVVARALAQLESAGAIKRARGRIASIDRGRLANFV
jgi:CRP/FNR family transcriptional regulator, cyclic AMP receptor protein